jgi:hypothetical protein
MTLSRKIDDSSLPLILLVSLLDAKIFHFEGPKNVFSFSLSELVFRILFAKASNGISEVKKVVYGCDMSVSGAVCKLVHLPLQTLC